MSPVYHDLQAQVQARPSVQAVVAKSQQLNILIDVPEVSVVVAGNTGPPGPKGDKGDLGAQGPQGIPGAWVQMTQAAYDALPAKDPNTLYVIVG